MSSKRSGLGKNLSALLGSSSSFSLLEKSPQLPAMQRLNINELHAGKYQPRSIMEEGPLQELAESIKQQGLLQPIVVRPLADEGYEIIAGERRWRACQLAGLTEVPVILQRVDDETAMAMALVENLQREDLNPIDQARAMARLSEEFSLTHQEIAELLSKSRAAVSNYLRLLALTAEVMELVQHGDLDMGHAKALLALDGEVQNQAAKLVIARNLSVRETEALVLRMKSGQLEVAAKDSLKTYPRAIHDTLDQLAARLQAKVLLKPSKAGRGSLVIQYESLARLEMLLSEI